MSSDWQRLGGLIGTLFMAQVAFAANNDNANCAALQPRQRPPGPDLGHRLGAQWR